MRLDEQIVMSDAAWAWEGLRRNISYRQSWARHRQHLPEVCDRHDSLRYIRLHKPYLEAETFGLIAFADPDLPSSETPVFWLPNLLTSTLPVRFDVALPDDDGSFSLKTLRCLPTILDTSDGKRMVRLGGHDFWIQLVGNSDIPIGEDARVSIKLDGRPGATRRLRTFGKLLSLHRSDARKVLRTTRRPSRDKLLEGLLAWDIETLEPGRIGSLRDIAIGLFGEARVSLDWASNRSLKDRAIRARDRGRAFVGGGYLHILRDAAS
ncbi:DNA -binding domain-containing protein [Algimonas ampicilliniresistens]|uniref:DNA -binding domain-containing protein n=1 Tax=Algimonas ampicilliniresistens TaxID=1298735 RepID=UPI0024E0E926|nr:DUF2285 domain-containing protein [Algimonas ampicilliniresistens]